MTAFPDTCKAIPVAQFPVRETPPERQAKATSQRSGSRRVCPISCGVRCRTDELMDAACQRNSFRHLETLVCSDAPHVERTPRAEAFIEALHEQFWLHLNELGSMPPDTQKLRWCTTNRQCLEPLIAQETQLFLCGRCSSKNLSIENFIDSDFTFANRFTPCLAHYVSAHESRRRVSGEFRCRKKIQLREVARSRECPLPATFHGSNPPPVTRGNWVLENILAPNASSIHRATDVEPLDTRHPRRDPIRQQLAKASRCRHVPPSVIARSIRSVSQLESFRSIGLFRREYLDSEESPPARWRPGGTLPTGESFIRHR